jgi:hypothetical protein
MTTPHDIQPRGDDVIPAEESPSFSGAAPRREEYAEATRLAQEINERRARVENPELLRNLRSL